MSWDIHTEEFAAWAKAYEVPRFHAVLCDPPYGLRFMGKDWDRVSAKEWGEAMMPLLHPGAIVLMFGGTRTWHKLATGMEEAGFEIWDTLMWLYGTGFPKAQDISKLIDKQKGAEKEIVGSRVSAYGIDTATGERVSREGGGAGLWVGKEAKEVPLRGRPATDTALPWSGHKTCALKPAWEPILCFRATRRGKNYAELAMEHGSGALNVDGGRISVSSSRPLIDRDHHGLTGNTWQGGLDGSLVGSRHVGQTQLGRYPANLVLDEESAEMLDGQTGTLVSGKSKPEYRKRAPNNIYGKYANDDMPINVIGDRGGASRFFYCAKASRSERERGLPKRDDDKSSNNHPTVKPIALTKWLATLLLPPNSVKPRRLLVPFSGVASEMIGAQQAGWDEVVGVEQDSDYSRIARSRLEYADSHPT